jgi:hypothetical protein
MGCGHRARPGGRGNRPLAYGPSPERTFIETARWAQIVAAAIDTIGEAGFAGASFARIAGNWGSAAA